MFADQQLEAGVIGTEIGASIMRLPNEQGMEGNYDSSCEAVHLALGMPDVVGLIVLGGPKGNGFSVVTRKMENLKELPAILRTIADGIEEGQRQAANQ